MPDPIALFIALYLAYLGCKSSLVLFYGVRKFFAAVLLLTSVVLAVGRFFFAVTDHESLCSGRFITISISKEVRR